MRKKIAVTYAFVLLLAVSPASACPFCNSPTAPMIRHLFNETLAWRTIWPILLQVLVFTIVVVRHYNNHVPGARKNLAGDRERGKFIAAGTLLGLGMGGFIDGILLHQVFQTHSFLSALLPQDDLVNVKTSMIWDGIFHLLAWTMALLGIILLTKLSRSLTLPNRGRIMAGSMIGGWGLFNTVEGLADHYLANLHHVVEAYGLSIYDHLFLASGILMMLAGILMLRRKQGPLIARAVD